MLARIVLSAAVLGIAMPVFAHPGHAGTTGFMHPLSGFDHVLAMISVGLWAARSEGRAVWLVPMAFMVAMVGGFAIAVAGIGVPAVEPRSMLVRGLGGAVAASGFLLLGGSP